MNIKQALDRLLGGDVEDKAIAAAVEAEIERLREDAEAGNDWERQLLGCDKELTGAYSEIERLEEMLKEAREDIHDDVANRYPEKDKYPAEMRRYERDMDIVWRIDAALAGKEGET